MLGSRGCVAIFPPIYYTPDRAKHLAERDCYLISYYLHMLRYCYYDWPVWSTICAVPPKPLRKLGRFKYAEPPATVEECVGGHNSEKTSVLSTRSRLLTHGSHGTLMSAKAPQCCLPSANGIVKLRVCIPSPPR